MRVYRAAIVHAPLVLFDAFARQSKNISAFLALAITFSACLDRNLVLNSVNIIITSYV